MGAMRTQETFAQLIARANASAYIPPLHEGTKMPKSVKLKKGQEFHFKSGRAGQAKYPWAEWFAPDPQRFPGGLIEIERSEVELTGEKDADGKDKFRVVKKRDYDVETVWMPYKIRVAARKLYKFVEISNRDADGNKLVDSLILHSRDMTPDERVAEDERRAEVKAALEAKAEKDEAESNGAVHAPAAEAVA